MLFVGCQTQQYSVRYDHNRTQNFLMVTITLKTFLNEKVGSFLPGDPIILATTKTFPHTNEI